MNNALKFFENAFHKQRLSHLYLLVGNKGIGKLELAYQVCNMILKDQKDDTDLIDKIRENNHSQVYHIAPEGTMIKKEQIIALQNEFSKTSLVNSPRIYIIENVDAISASAANSLLKFMEEPESNQVYGILITANTGQVLPTIISRSQIVRVKENDTLISKNLVANGFAQEKSLFVELLTKDYEQAVIYMNDEKISAIIEFFSNYLKDFMDIRYHEMIELEKEIPFIMYEREYYLIFLTLMLTIFLDAWYYDNKEKIRISHYDRIYDKINKKVDNKKILEIIDLIQEEIIKQNIFINISLSLENLMIKIKKLVV
ncbi:MAG: AAA family ATPase [Acholeplasma sp.]|nr:AAA family ATPase [Acholeplasma sp.]